MFKENTSNAVGGLLDGPVAFGAFTGIVSALALILVALVSGSLHSLGGDDFREYLFFSVYLIVGVSCMSLFPRRLLDGHMLSLTAAGLLIYSVSVVIGSISTRSWVVNHFSMLAGNPIYLLGYLAVAVLAARIVFAVRRAPVFSPSEPGILASMAILYGVFFVSGAFGAVLAIVYTALALHRETTQAKGSIESSETSEDDELEVISSFPLTVGGMTGFLAAIAFAVGRIGNELSEHSDSMVFGGSSHIKDFCSTMAGPVFLVVFILAMTLVPKRFLNGRILSILLTSMFAFSSIAALSAGSRDLTLFDTLTSLVFQGQYLLGSLMIGALIVRLRGGRIWHSRDIKLVSALLILFIVSYLMVGPIRRLLAPNTNWLFP